MTCPSNGNFCPKYEDAIIELTSVSKVDKEFDWLFPVPHVKAPNWRCKYVITVEKTFLDKYKETYGYYGYIMIQIE